MGNKRKVFFRADAGAKIGYGHFIRSLALADMLKEDFDCTFFTVQPSAYQLDELKKVCGYVALDEGASFEEFLTYLNGDEIVVLDNYFFNTDYQERIKEKGSILVCIDDMHDKHYVADAVINHGVVYPGDFDCESYTQLYLGKDYELLRRPFLQPLRGLKRENTAIVSFGGADPLRITDRIITLLQRINTPYHIVAILGDKTYLSEENRGKVEIRKNLTAQQMADIFETSAFGILSTSTVSLEAMSRELPVMIGYYVDNQEEGYKRFSQRGSFIPLGHLPELTEKNLVDAIQKLSSFVPSKRNYSTIIDHYKDLFHSLSHDSDI